MTEELLGRVRHFYPRVHAAAIEIERGSLHEGDTLRIVGHGQDLIEPVRSIQIDNEPVHEAGPGDIVGVLLDARVKENDEVYLLREDEADA
ncbi:MAG: translation elongation factor-like protein [Euryarchaeota archaeon]|nr:translation elongation factor-like protein [Euryarchaeota archaeon]